MKYKDAATKQPSVRRSSHNLTRIGDALTASIALAVVVAVVCLLTEAPARAVLLAALAPWGLLALGRLLALATIAIEEFLEMIGHEGRGPSCKVKHMWPWPWPGRW